MKKIQELPPRAQSALQATVGVVLVSVGVGWAFGPGVGLAALGATLYLDYAVRAALAAKEPRRNDDPR